MARQLLDGVNSVMSFTTQLFAAGVLTGTPTEHKCWVNTMMIALRQDVLYLPKITFCTVPGWKDKAPQERDLEYAISGILSKGAVGDKIGSIGFDGGKVAIVGTFDDPTPGSQGVDCCAIGFTSYMNTDQASIIAQGSSARAIRGESTGAPSLVWVEA